MRLAKFTALAIVSIVSVLPAVAQGEVEMADTMRSEGKIYVVVAILLVILVGLSAYLFVLDRKVSRLEKKVLEKP